MSRFVITLMDYYLSLVRFHVFVICYAQTLNARPVILLGRLAP